MTDPTTAYAARADEYIDLLGSMSAVHPLDRQVVDSWAERRCGRVLDAGCGPGHWTNHLSRAGLDVRGIDLVPAFLSHARGAYPGIPFDLRSLDDIDEPDGALDGVLSWFSTIHHTPEAIATPIAEFARTIRPGGELLLGFFSGSAVEPFDHVVLTAYRWPAESLHRILDACGFDIAETHLRAVRGERPVGTVVAVRRAA